MSPVLAAAVLGAGGGLRSFAPPAVLAARGRGLFPGGARFVAFGAAAGELVADKQPDMGSRWAPRGLSLRLGFSAMAGHDLAGPAGAAAAAAAALVAARVGSLLRGRLSGRPAALPAALLEDAVSYGLVVLATR
ncbi:MAG TPA: hypothetical protein VGF93_01360 [Solirubrobacteraceae bacterium]